MADVKGDSAPKFHHQVPQQKWAAPWFGAAPLQLRWQGLLGVLNRNDHGRGRRSDNHRLRRRGRNYGGLRRGNNNLRRRRRGHLR